jgi:CRISPR-associated protein Cas2
MKIYNYLICYDISDDKRLRKTAKILEQSSQRIQKSIYVYQTGLKKELQNLIEQINDTISDEDDVRIYKIDINSSLSINSAIDLKLPNIIGALSHAKYI